MSPCALQVRGRVSLKHTVRGPELESPQPDSRPLGELGQRAAMVLRFHSSTIAERNVLHWCIMCALSLISHTICASPRVSQPRLLGRREGASVIRNGLDPPRFGNL